MYFVSNKWQYRYIYTSYFPFSVKTINVKIVYLWYIYKRIWHIQIIEVLFCILYY